MAPERSTMYRIPVGADEALTGDLVVPAEPAGLVVFAHGSGSNRLSPRNRKVAQYLNSRGLATMLMDLLTLSEEARDRITRRYRFDIDLLGARVVTTIDYLDRLGEATHLPVACFGASTGAAAALVAAAERPGRVAAVVSRGGRPDLAGDALAQVQAPTLLIVGEADPQVLELNRQAASRMRAPVQLHVVPRATHLFEEPGTLEEVQQVTADWLLETLGPAAS
jgi:pimeloyl-ACP methyl ester carboxylesterase